MIAMLYCHGRGGLSLRERERERRRREETVRERFWFIVGIEYIIDRLHDYHTNVQHMQNVNVILQERTPLRKVTSRVVEKRTALRHRMIVEAW